MDTTIDKVSIEIDSNSKSATTGIYSLVTQLNNLKTATSGSYKNLSRLSTYLKELKSSSQGLEKVSNNLSGLSNISKSLGKLSNIPKATGLSSVIKTLKTLPDISSQLSNTEIEKFVNKINELTNAIKPLATQVTKLTSGLQKLPTSLNKINKEIDKTKNKSKGSGKGIYSFLSTGLTGTITKLSLVLMTMKRIGSTLKGFVDESANYTESLNLFTVSMGSYAEQATAFIEKFSSSLYLDPSQLMQYMGAFQNLITGLGVGEEKAYTMSTTLTQLAYDLSSFKNISIESAFEKLQSGISGEIEPLRNMGVALSVATLQELALSLGIKENVANMTEAQKSQLRYIQILKSSSNWQGDMARTLISPANAMRVIQQQFILLARAIGNVFIPILMASLPYVMVFTQALTSLANQLASMLGFKIADIDYSSLSNGSQYASDLSDSADDATDSLNGMLASFDDLNVVQKASGDSGKLSGSDLGIDLDTYDALAGLNNQFTAGMDKAKHTLSELLPLVGSIATVLATMWAVSKIATFGEAIQGLLGVAGAGTAFGTGLAGIAVALTTIGALYVAWLGYKATQDTAKAIDQSSASTEDLADNTNSVVKNYALLASQGKLTGDELTKYTAYLTNNSLRSLENSEALESQKNLFSFLHGDYGEINADIAINTQNVDFNAQAMQALYDQGLITREELDKYRTSVGLTSTAEETLTGKTTDVSYSLQDLKTDVENNGGAWETWKQGVGYAIENVQLWLSNTSLGQLEQAISDNGGAWQSWKDGIAVIVNGAMGLFEGFANGVIDAFNFIKRGINSIKLDVPSWLTELTGVGDLGFNLGMSGHISLPRFEDGGFPDSASLFFANENGVPEMVGQMGNRTAVANNDQITTGIENAVYRAMISANSSKSTEATQVTVNVGNKTLYKEGAKYSSKQVDRYGNTVIKV